MSDSEGFGSVHLSFGLGLCSAWDGKDSISVCIQNEEFEDIKVISCSATWRMEDESKEYDLPARKVRWVRPKPFADSWDSFIFPRRLESACILQCGFELTPEEIKAAGIDTNRYPLHSGDPRLDYIVLQAVIELQSKSGESETKGIRYHHRQDKGTTGRRIELPQPSKKKKDEISVEVTDLDDMLPLARRRSFDNNLVEFAEQAVSTGLPLSLVMIDVDHFKAVNDNYGHPIGDAVLKSIATQVLSYSKNKGKGFRYGGEELAVLLPNYCAEEAFAFAERLRLSIKSLPHSSENLKVTVSLGVACIPEHASDAAELVRLADEALYAAKAGGRNKARISGKL